MKQRYSVQIDDLVGLQRRGRQSAVIDARLAFTDAESIRRYVAPLERRERVYPNHLPTQASGRWSTTDPPLVNFTKRKEYGPNGIRDIVVPDPGTAWIGWDWDGIEAVLAAIFSGEESDLAHIRARHDLHTITGCHIFKLPLPPVLTKAGIYGPAGAEWRRATGWTETDWRRDAAKTARYALGYSLEAGAILEARGAMDVVAQIASATRQPTAWATQRLIGIGSEYLHMRPRLVAWKSRVMTQCAETGLSRTFLGRIRRLYGDRRDKMKQGLNHQAQGAVADMMNTTIIAILKAHPEATLVVNRHDGCEIAVPADAKIDLVPFVECEWDVAGTMHSFSASYHRVEAV
jgi:hypothetical protein